MVGFPSPAGAYAETVVAREGGAGQARRGEPQAGAALPLAGLTAWQGLLEHGGLAGRGSGC